MSDEWTGRLPHLVMKYDPFGKRSQERVLKIHVLVDI